MKKDNLMKMDLQFFAEEDTDNSSNEEGKTFTQDELDAIVADRVSREQKKQDNLANQLEELKSQFQMLKQEKEAERFERMTEDEQVESLKQKLAEYEAKETFDKMFDLAKNRFMESELKAKDSVPDEVLCSFVDTEDAETTNKNIHAFVKFLEKYEETVTANFYKGQTPQTSSIKPSENEGVNPYAKQKNELEYSQSIQSNWD